MASASVLIPFDVINQNGGVLPPSVISQHTPRNGRSRGASVNGKSAGGRGYRVVEDSNATVAKAVTFVLKRSVSESELESDMDESDYLVSNADGWVSVAHLLEQPRMKDLGIKLADIQRAANSSKARFTLRQLPDTDKGLAGSYQVRRESKRDSLAQASLVAEGEPLNLESASLPEYIVYETTYHAYPLVLASGGIRRPDGAPYLPFLPAANSDETRPNRVSKADVSIWIHLRTAMTQVPSITWQYTTTGRIVTAAEDVPKALWTKVVARRPDLGVLFEDGEVRKEIHDALRRKGAKGQAKSKGLLKQEGIIDSESDSVSDEM
ncbi:putative tRNA 2'-phosphotransferase 1 [Biscogniauxia mediterranea]|nr:putative tRNA 2'-phosphotransferase 1 [Biscogniauxia mediterranea]